MPEEIHNDVQQTQRHTTMPVVEQLSIALGILLLVFGTTYIPDVLRGLDGEGEQARSPQAAAVAAAEEKEFVDPFADIQIEAESAYVWDVQNQRALYGKAPDTRWPLASVTKLMTGLLSYELLGATETVQIGMEAIQQDGDSGFWDGEAFTVQNLLDLTLINSSNDGAYALASAAGDALGIGIDSATTFVEAMNLYAEDLGLTQTHFKNPTGLDISETESGAYGSSRDMAFLMEYILTKRPAVMEFSKDNYRYIANTDGQTHEAANTNLAVADIPGLIASKTGYTTLAGGNLVVAYNAGLNRPIIVSVLGSSYDGRFSDVLKLIEATNKLIQSEK